MMTLLTQLYVRVGIALMCRKRLHENNISRRGEVGFIDLVYSRHFL